MSFRSFRFFRLFRTWKGRPLSSGQLTHFLFQGKDGCAAPWQQNGDPGHKPHQSRTGDSFTIVLIYSRSHLQLLEQLGD